MREVRRSEAEINGVKDAWLWSVRSGLVTPGQPQQITLDLRNYHIWRGEEGPPPSKPLVLPRGRLDLSMFLPVGSREGDYEVGIVKEPDKLVATAPGFARLEDHNTVLKTKLDLSPLGSGEYLLAIRRAGMEWSYYPLTVK